MVYVYPLIICSNACYHQQPNRLISIWFDYVHNGTTHRWMLWMCIHGNECLLHLVPTDWAVYRTKHNTIAANHSTAKCFVALGKPSKWLAVLAQAMQLFKIWMHDFFLPDFNCMFQWTNSKHDCHNSLWSVHLAI